MEVEVEVYNQKELESALESGAYPLLRGNGKFEVTGSSQVRACGSSQVTAYDKSQVTAYDESQVTACDSSQVTACDSSQVTAYGSSQVRACGYSQVTACGYSQVRAYGSSQVTAYESSQVTAYESSQVTAYGSSQVTAYDSSQVTACGSSQVIAYGSSQVRACGSSQVTAYGSSQVTAYESSQVIAYGSSQVRASKYVAVTILGKPNVVGGVKIRPRAPRNVDEWIADYGIRVRKGVVILYKAVGDDFKSAYGTSYEPGSTPSAADWDGGKAECGGGLHFCPSPALALTFHRAATRFVACPVKVSEIAFRQDAAYPTKVKAPRVCAPVWECDIDGKKLQGGKENQ
jgi:hypothetical protein